ncbi:hypothetical protein HOV30_gp205 [Erwinia phage Derbicus]|uniref:Virion structural protein n=2 Tax=Derbicusvirus derbicus TaxID=2734104 RepID=A0A482II02_9CAUD|nr:hypothetical protein BIZ82_gp206 [Erwinia phage vB_EamM_EarlPhillipIV]YP_009821249.1 hypothetical protein HOV30_gp205 [Erwinia phage Derbicus]ANZ49055.1 hypothetical protein EARLPHILLIPIV_206 [Erwinia phage vB_EamM_EarlPhillipIV]QBP07631.1 hypothetical protein DERBICUS_205 [Erwinia phage Derbicus]
MSNTVQPDPRLVQAMTELQDYQDKLGERIKAASVRGAGSGTGPTTRPTIFETDPKGLLPDLDPLLRKVATPFEGMDKLGDSVLKYFDPTGKLGSFAKKAVNALPSELKEAGTKLARGDVVDAAKGITGLNNFRDLKSLVTTKDGSFGLDFSSVKGRIEKSFGLGGNGLGGLSPDVQNLIGKAANEVMGEGSMGMVWNEVFTAVQGADFASVSSVTDVINRIAKQSDLWDVFDLSGAAALIYGLSDKLIEWDAPDMLDDVLDKIKDVNAQKAMLDELAIRASASGSLSSTEHYVSRLDANRKAAIADLVITNMMRSVSFWASDSRDTSYAEYGSRLKKLFDSLDPNWDKDPYDNTGHSCYYFTLMNDTAYQAFLTTDKRPFCAVFGIVRREDVDTIISNNF